MCVADRFCAGCGNGVEGMTFCVQCGRRVTGFHSTQVGPASLQTSRTARGEIDHESNSEEAPRLRGDRRNPRVPIRLVAVLGIVIASCAAAATYIESAAPPEVVAPVGPSDDDLYWFREISGDLLEVVGYAQKVRTDTPPKSKSGWTWLDERYKDKNCSELSRIADLAASAADTAPAKVASLVNESAALVIQLSTACVSRTRSEMAAMALQVGILTQDAHRRVDPIIMGEGDPGESAKAIAAKSSLRDIEESSSKPVFCVGSSGYSWFSVVCA